MFSNYNTVFETVTNGFGGKSVLVVGDIMLDRYLWGHVDRISPEAPVPVVHLAKETDIPGGAANVAINLRGLGLKVHLAGIIGQDVEGGRLIHLLREREVDTKALVRVDTRPTTTKLRVVSKQQQMLRIDTEDTSDCGTATEKALLKSAQDQLPSVDALVLSDYAKGVLTPSLCRDLIRMAKARGCPVFVDPKATSFDKYAGATTLTPNTAELCTATDTEPDDVAALMAAAKALRERLDLDSIVLTRGEKGISLVDASGASHYLATAHEVYDVSGAGDTVIATLVAGSLGGLQRADTLHLANLAAGIVIGKVGAVGITTADLLRALRQVQPFRPSDKLCYLDLLKRRLDIWRSRGETIVFTNGCFDLLHAGHISFLERAKALGDRLIIGLNTDRSVRVLKGEERPVIAEDDRARVLAGLSAVDAVILFDEDTPLDLICEVRPDLLVKGNDYQEKDVVGAKEVQTWGGRVELMDLVEGQSTTGILIRAKRVTQS